jgi:hypothetical protein
MKNIIGFLRRLFRSKSKKVILPLPPGAIAMVNSGKYTFTLHDSFMVSVSDGDSVDILPCVMVSDALQKCLFKDLELRSRETKKIGE